MMTGSGRSRVRLTVEEVFDEEIHVLDRARDGAPDADVRELLAPRVELERVVERVGLDLRVEASKCSSSSDGRDRTGTGRYRD